MDYNVERIDLATARPAGAGLQVQAQQRALYAVAVPASFDIRFGSPNAPAIPISTAGRICACAGPIGQFYIENEAAAGELVLVLTDSLDLDFFPSSAAGIAAQVASAIQAEGQTFEQVLPGVAGGGAVQLDRFSSSRDIWSLDQAGGGTLTIVNDATRQARAWQLQINAAAGTGRQHIRRNRKLVNLLQLVGDSGDTIYRPDFGMYFIECDLAITNLVDGGNPQWLGVLLSFDNANLRPAGLVFSPFDLGPNWRLVIAEQAFNAGFTGIALNLDTGVAANAGASVWRRLRVEAGTVAGVPTLRAVIDGVVVATQTGPVAVLTALQIAACALEPSIGYWNNAAPATTDTMTVLIGASIGIRSGWFAA